MPNNHGAFVFRNEGDGCLTGKYIHSNTMEPYTECCKLKGSSEKDAIPKNTFIGEYTSTWIEKNQVVDGTLKITPHSKSSYDLEWAAKGGTRFIGIGMLFGDLMIGSYYYVL